MIACLAVHFEEPAGAFFAALVDFQAGSRNLKSDTLRFLCLLLMSCLPWILVQAA